MCKCPADRAPVPVTPEQMFHNDSVLAKYGAELCIGAVAGTAAAAAGNTGAGETKAPSPARGPSQFGDLVPYGDPTWCGFRCCEHLERFV